MINLFWIHDKLAINLYNVVSIYIDDYRGVVSIGMSNDRTYEIELSKWEELKTAFQK